jgi:hypothetical protein
LMEMEKEMRQDQRGTPRLPAEESRSDCIG